MNINELIIKASSIAQRCQRNWDVNSVISEDTLDTLKQVIKNAPTKQNEEYYSVEFITDRSVIENIYQTTTYDKSSQDDRTKNPQVLANLLVVFFCEFPNTYRNPEHEYEDHKGVMENVNTSIGIASGQLALSATLLGLSTGFCACFDVETVSQILNKKNPKLILGIGYPDTSKSRLQHHKTESFFRSYNKPLKIYHNQHVDKSTGITPNPNPSITMEYFPPSSISLDHGMLLFRKYDKFEDIIRELLNRLNLELLELGITANENNHSIIMSAYSKDIDKLTQFKKELINQQLVKEFHKYLEDAGWSLKF
jgi:nitroreductase